MIVVFRMDLGAELKNPIMLSLVLHHHLSLSHTVGKWFLTVDIFTGLKGKRGNLGMPMVGCCARDRIDVIAVQHVPEVTIPFGLAIRPQFFQVLQCAVQVVFVQIAQGYDFHIG